MSIPYEPGAPAENGSIPLCVPEIRGNEWKYVKDCLDSGWVSSVGTYVSRFEQQMAELVGVHHAVATVNGTAALHIALLVAGIKPDDEVLVSTLTFIAPVNAIRYAGAWPVFVDAEPTYWQMDPEKVVEFLEQDCEWDGATLRNRTTGRRVRAIIPVHILGHPVDLDPILEIAARFNLAVIEDATESLGTLYKGRMTGSLGSVACFSFNGNKLITTGGGGMLVTDNPEWAEKARYLTTQAKDDPLEYRHREIGYNYRLTNMQAAMGCAQLEQVADYIATKRRIAHRYNAALQDLPGITPMPEAPWATSSFWLYTILVDEALYGRDSRSLLRALAEAKIQTRPLWQPMHQSEAHAQSQTRTCATADRLVRQGLSLPCSVGLTDEQLQTVVCQVQQLGASPKQA